MPGENHTYFSFRESVKEHFREYTGSHSFEECVCYYDEIETYNETDAVLFALCMLARFGATQWDRDRTFTDHLGCVAYHSGTTAMLIDLLEAGSAIDGVPEQYYINELIRQCVKGLSKTARQGFSYGNGKMEELRSFAALRSKRENNKLLPGSED